MYANYTEDSVPKTPPPRKLNKLATIIFFTIVLVWWLWDPYSRGKASDLALFTSCKCHLKAIYYGLQQYLIDNNDILPEPSNLYTSLVPKYVSPEEFQCPLRERYFKSKKSDYIVCYKKSRKYDDKMDKIILLRDLSDNHSRSYKKEVSNTSNILLGDGSVESKEKNE